MDAQVEGVTAQIVSLRPEPKLMTATMTAFANDSLAGRFCAWRGASERRYVTSVYPVDRRADDIGLPEFQGFVLIAVAQGPAGRRVVAVASIERGTNRQMAIATGLARGAAEWHVHLIADTRASRASIVADIAGRHLSSNTEALCA